MTQIVEFNGEELEFPDNMNDADIEAVLKKESAAAPDNRNLMQRGVDSVKDFGTSALSGITALPLGMLQAESQGLSKAAGYAGLPETAAALNNSADTFQKVASDRQIQTNAATERSPIAGTVGNILPQIGQVAGMGTSLPGVVGAGATMGALSPQLTDEQKAMLPKGDTSFTRTLEPLANTGASAIEALGIDPNSREGQALLQAGLGALTYGTAKGTGAIIGKTTKVLRPRIAEGVTNRVTDFLSKQFTPEEAAHSLKRMQELEAINVKAPLGAASTSEPIFQIASTRAKTLEGARDAKTSLDTVIKGITNAENDFVTNLAAKSKDSLDDATVFKTSATSIKNAIIDARRAKAAPLYEAIQDKRIPPNLVKSLVQNNPIIARELGNIGNDPVMLQLLGDAKPNTVGFLDKLKQSMDGKIDVAVRTGDSSSIKAYTAAKNNLIAGVEKYVPAYKQARYAFEKDSNILDSFLGGKKGAINKIVQLADQDANKSYAQIFSLQPEQITQVRRTFEKLGQKDAFGALTRGYLSQKLAKVAGSQNEQVLLSRVLNNKIDRERVIAAVGDPKKVNLFNEVLKASDVVQRSKELSPGYGSQTFMRGEMEKQMQQEFQSNLGRVGGKVGRLRQRITGLSGFSTKELQEISKKEQYYTELQKVLFDPESGQQFLKDYLKANSPASKSKVIATIISRAARNTAPPAAAATQNLIMGQQ